MGSLKRAGQVTADGQTQLPKRPLFATFPWSCAPLWVFRVRKYRYTWNYVFPVDFPWINKQDAKNPPISSESSQYSPNSSDLSSHLAPIRSCQCVAWPGPWFILVSNHSAGFIISRLFLGIIVFYVVQIILNCWGFAGGHGHQKHMVSTGEDDRESDRLTIGSEFWRRECRLHRKS